MASCGIRRYSFGVLLKTIRHKTVLHTLATRYERSNAGRTGRGVLDLIRDYEDLLVEAGAAQGEERVCAERDLLDAERAGLLVVERHRRTGKPERVRFAAANEARLFSIIGQTSPTQRRTELASIFQEAGANTSGVPDNRRSAWIAFCEARAADALTGASLQPFDCDAIHDIREVLALLPRLLTWRGDSLMRFASSLLCGDSKRLEKLRPRLENSLGRITGGEVNTLADLGITENGRSCLLHGPVRMAFTEGELDLELLSAAARIDRRDLERAEIRTSATRVVTVENAAMFHELCNLRTEAILASSGSEGGYANSATVAFLQRLPSTVQCWHFGDSDPAGFDILRDLRDRTRRVIGSLQMAFRDNPESRALEKKEFALIEALLASAALFDPEKAELRKMRDSGRVGRFEQESLGRPHAVWPFYPGNW